MLSNVFGIPAIAVDTHVFWAANRLKLTDSDNVLKSEKQQMALTPQENWSCAHHWLIWHGRLYCKARIPNCLNCKLNSFCPAEENKKSKSI